MIFHVLNETLSCSLILNLFLIKQRETVRTGNEEPCLFWFWRLHKYAGRDITGYFFHLIWWSSSNHMLKYSTSLHVYNWLMEEEYFFFEMLWKCEEVGN